MNQHIPSIVIAVFASSGFWAFLQWFIQSRRKAKSAEERLLMGLAYSKICDLAEKYIERGSISKTEYEDLKKYLYDPYREMGGNGTCERLMSAVDKLPIKGGSE